MPNIRAAWALLMNMLRDKKNLFQAAGLLLHLFIVFMLWRISGWVVLWYVLAWLIIGTLVANRLAKEGAL